MLAEKTFRFSVPLSSKDQKERCIILHFPPSIRCSLSVLPPTRSPARCTSPLDHKRKVQSILYLHDQQPRTPPRLFTFFFFFLFCSLPSRRETPPDDLTASFCLYHIHYLHSILYRAKHLQVWQPDFPQQTRYYVSPTRRLSPGIIMTATACIHTYPVFDVLLRLNVSKRGFFIKKFFTEDPHFVPFDI